MKKYLFLVSTIFFFTNFKEKEETVVPVINIYFVKWDAIYKVDIDSGSILKKYKYFFSAKGYDFENMFFDYEDCLIKLNSSNTIQKEVCSVRSCVEFNYKDYPSFRIYFDNDGNYLFKGKWHAFVPNLYFYLFKYFSEELVPPDKLVIAKKKTLNDFWNK